METITLTEEELKLLTLGDKVYITTMDREELEISVDLSLEKMNKFKGLYLLKLI